MDPTPRRSPAAGSTRGEGPRARAVVLADVPAICAVHAGSDGPWLDPVQCAICVNHRLLGPFVCRVADDRGRVVGHAEWIVGRDPAMAAPYLYLGLLQVRPDARGTGVGRILIEDGLDLARRHDCDRLRTVPDDGAVGFYARCGFRRSATARGFRMPVTGGSLDGWRRARSVPTRVARTLPMRLGWVQACSSHMWEICNRPLEIAGDPWSHPCVTKGEGAAYVQLRHSHAEEALAVAWAHRDVPLEDLISAAGGLASSRRIGSLILAVRAAEAPSMSAARPDGEIAVMERTIRAIPGLRGTERAGAPES